MLLLFESLFGERWCDGEIDDVDVGVLGVVGADDVGVVEVCCDFGGRDNEVDDIDRRSYTKGLNKSSS